MAIKNLAWQEWLNTEAGGSIGDSPWMRDEARYIFEAGQSASRKASKDAAPPAPADDDDETPEPTSLDIAYAKGYGDGIKDGERKPAPAAVPVDGDQNAAIVEAAKLAYGLLWMGTDLSGPEFAGRARVALRDALGKPRCGEGITAARASLATHPQPAAATGVPELFVQWLEREMPAGTIIGKPAWWAPKLARALRSAERGVLGNCNGN